MYLRKAYEIVLEKINTCNWNECCKQALVELKDAAVTYIICPRTLQRWNVEFRMQKRFVVSYHYKETEPRLFSISPETKEILIKYSRIKYISLMTQLDGNTKAFVIASDTFTIR